MSRYKPEQVYREIDGNEFIKIVWVSDLTCGIKVLGIYQGTYVLSFDHLDTYYTLADDKSYELERLLRIC